MAIITAIPERTQNRTAMKRVLAYVMQDYKTTYKGVKLVSGQNCIPESAYTEFMATKNQYRKQTVYSLSNMFSHLNPARQHLN